MGDVRKGMQIVLRGLGIRVHPPEKPRGAEERQALLFVGERESLRSGARGEGGAVGVGLVHAGGLPGG